MKKKILGLIIGTTLATNAYAVNHPLEDASIQVMNKMAELAMLASNPENVPYSLSK